MPALPDFDVAALYAALDAERAAQGISWQQVARAISDPFGEVPSPPISVSTIIRTRAGGSVEGDGALQMLRWLGRTPESFVPGHPAPEAESCALPRLGRDRILRFDSAALHQALEAQRQERNLTWAQVAAEIGGFSAASLQTLKKGGRVGFPSVMRLTGWLGRPAAAFTRAADR